MFPAVVHDVRSFIVIRRGFEEKRFPRIELRVPLPKRPCGLRRRMRSSPTPNEDELLHEKVTVCRINKDYEASCRVTHSFLAMFALCNADEVNKEHRRNEKESTPLGKAESA